NAADGQRFDRDVRRGRGAAGSQLVVGRIGAADRDAAHTHRLGRPYGLVGKGRRAVGPAQAVAGNPVVGKCDRGIGRSVIHFVHAGGTDRERPRGDVRRGAGGGVGRVVGGIHAADGDAVTLTFLAVPTFLS